MIGASLGPDAGTAGMREDQIQEPSSCPPSRLSHSARVSDKPPK